MISPKVTEALKKPMTQNFMALVLLQGVNYLLPLITFPFLFRVLGVERWGLISFGYTFIQYFVLFTDFGFNLSATKYISSHRDDINQINRYLNSAFICRIFLGIISFIILFLLITVFGRFQQDAGFYLLYFGIVIGNVMFPMWFFQGMEKMKYITVFNIVAKLLSFIPVFIFIHKPEDYILVPVFYTIGYIFAGLISIYIIYVKEKMKWFLPTFAEIRFALTDSSTYFLSRLSVSMFTNSNSFIIGLVCGNVAVGYYSAAEKLYQAYNWLLTPFTGVLFPHMSNKRDIPFFKRIFKILIPANIVIVGGLLFLSYWVIQIIYGRQTQPDSLYVFRILMAGCFWTIPSILMGYPFLAALGHASYVNWTVVIVSIFHIAGLLTLILSGFLTIYSVAAMVILAELLLFAFRMRGVHKFNLFHT
ncbi:MAG: oligosaccharide flippase family protein [Tannerellaceae bacterium]|jgi:PST family polysaccharide transporter|nr:oligosaccharide flippase family protein [Tannerellaceae bacterium]